MHAPKLPQNPAMQEAGRRLRSNMTPQENKLWYCCLRRHTPRVLRQYTIGSYIADFYCPTARCVIEVDGAPHWTVQGRANDGARDAFMVSLGLHILRFTDDDIDYRFKDVCRMIDNVLQKQQGGPPCS